jgi:hypothetical protein
MCGRVKNTLEVPMGTALRPGSSSMNNNKTAGSSIFCWFPAETQANVNSPSGRRASTRRSRPGYSWEWCVWLRTESCRSGLCLFLTESTGESDRMGAQCCSRACHDNCWRLLHNEVDITGNMHCDGGWVPEKRSQNNLSAARWRLRIHILCQRCTRGRGRSIADGDL